MPRRRASARADAIRRAPSPWPRFSGSTAMRADFSEIRAVTFQRKAADDTSMIFLNDESGRYWREFLLRRGGAANPARHNARRARESQRRQKFSRDAFSWIFLELGEPRFEILQRGANSARSGPAGDVRDAPARIRASAPCSDLGPNAGENSCSRSSGISRMDFPSCSAARSTFPTISCASRKGTPKVTR